jgi:lipopolysaccharide exporter
MYGSQAMGHFLKYSMLPLLGGVAFGGTAAGYATWGHQVATLPMQLSNLVARVAYPAFSHVQEHREELNTLMSNALKWTGRVTFTLFAVIMALAPQITEFVYGAKWLPALTTLLLLCLSMALGTPVTVLLPALFALGRARTGMVISLGWTALTWIAGLILVFSGVGYDALAWAYLAASVVAAASILYALREFDLPRFLRSILQPLAISLGGGLLLWAVGGALVHGLLALIVAATIGGLVILLANLWPDRKEILDTLNTRTAYMWR